MARRGRPLKEKSYAQKLKDLEKDGPVWSFYQVHFAGLVTIEIRPGMFVPPDPNRKGPKERAIEACMDRFDIDRTTVRRKIRNVDAIMSDATTVTTGSTISFTNDSTKKEADAMIDDAVARGTITKRLSKTLKEASAADVARLIDRLKK
ncbi:MAG TPA: hypothetical protein VGI90_09915 [Steroidobacteraceae bacterium]|jgi:hypothetical protein